MLHIGLTGGIGSGKSTVARIFEVLGIPVYYSDHAAKRLMNTDPSLKEAIIQEFGIASYQHNQLDRHYISSIVYNDPDKLKKLNALTHPVTINDAKQWMLAQTAPYTIKEAALLFESGSYKDLDYIIGVQSTTALRIQRVMQRDHISEDEVQKRMARQMNEEEKLQRCDFIIINNEEELVIPQVISLHEKIRMLATRG